MPSRSLLCEIKNMKILCRQTSWTNSTLKNSIKEWIKKVIIQNHKNKFWLKISFAIITKVKNKKKYNTNLNNNHSTNSGSYMRSPRRGWLSKWSDPVQSNIRNSSNITEKERKIKIEICNPFPFLPRPFIRQHIITVHISRGTRKTWNSCEKTASAISELNGRNVKFNRKSESPPMQEKHAVLIKTPIKIETRQILSYHNEAQSG